MTFKGVRLQGLKPQISFRPSGTAKAVPFQNRVVRVGILRLGFADAHASLRMTGLEFRLSHVSQKRLDMGHPTICLCYLSACLKQATAIYETESND